MDASAIDAAVSRSSPAPPPAPARAIAVPPEMIIETPLVDGAAPTPAPPRDAGPRDAGPRDAKPNIDAPPNGSALSDQQASILAFERQWWRYAGAKEQAIRDLFDMSPTRYYQALNAMLDSADAMAHDPALVKRLRRLRASRLRARGR